MEILRKEPLAFSNFDPAPPSSGSGLKSLDDEKQIINLEKSISYLFRNDSGQIIHRYDLPDDSDILNCGGYIDKIIKYRSRDLFDYLQKNGVCTETLTNGSFPLLNTRSPLLDLIIFGIILQRLNETNEKLSLFDLGCTVGEHYDLLDVMVRADERINKPLYSLINYHGIDKSELVLKAGYTLHGDLSRESFKLTCSEGSSHCYENYHDVGLCVGVIHNLKNPLKGLHDLVRASRIATIVALWVCSLEEGLWLYSHHAEPMFIFGKKEIKSLREKFPKKYILVSDFIPESLSTQNRHFVGISQEAIEELGCYHLIITDNIHYFDNLPELMI